MREEDQGWSERREEEAEKKEKVVMRRKGKRERKWRRYLMRIEILPLGHVHLLGRVEPAGQGVRLLRLQRQAELELLVVDQSD